MNPVDIRGIVDKYNHNRGSLLGILAEIQARYSHLPEEALRIVADHTNHSLVDIFGVATFYKSFSLVPRGKHLCSVCMGTACHVRNAPVITKEFERQLNTKTGQTTEDREFSLETVNCLGACALGPIVVVDGHYFSNVKTQRVEQIINESRTGFDRIEVKTDERIFPVEVSCARCNHSLMDQEYLIDGYPSIRVTTSYGRKHGWLRLSRLYGSYNVETECNTPKDEVINFFCPHCHSELVGASKCVECGAPMVPMIVHQGGFVQICSRNGCRGHLLIV